MKFESLIKSHNFVKLVVFVATEDIDRNGELILLERSKIDFRINEPQNMKNSLLLKVILVVWLTNTLESG